MLSALIRTVPLVVLLIPVRAWGWGNDGHYIAAVIAADNLTETTAHKLEQKYASERPMDVWVRGRTDDIAWESNQIARSDIYMALRIPIEPCEPPAGRCGNEPDVDLSSAYLDQAGIIAGHQLANGMLTPLREIANDLRDLMSEREGIGPEVKLMNRPACPVHRTPKGLGSSNPPFSANESLRTDTR